MARKYNGVQSVLLQKNSNCIFSSCGNHTLNLVGVDCAESCKEAVTYFGTIQQMYNLFSSSPQRWEILKNHLPVSLHGMPKALLHNAAQSGVNSRQPCITAIHLSPMQNW